MSNLTFEDARIELEAFAPAGSLDTNLCAAMRRLCDAEWRGNKDEVMFNVGPGGVFTLPRQYSSVLAAKVDGYVRDMANEWYEYMEGVNDSLQAYGDTVRLIGTNFCTFAEPPAASFLLVQCDDFTEENSSVLVFGRDENGDAIYTGEAPTVAHGESLAFGTPGSARFAKVSSILLPVTRAPKYLYAVDPDTSAQTLIGLYEPGETRPAYSRYEVQRAITTQTSVTVSALCRRQYVKPIADTDLIFPAHTGALSNAMQTVHYELEGDTNRAEVHFESALKLLGREITAARAPGETSPIRVFTVGQGMAEGIPNMH